MLKKRAQIKLENDDTEVTENILDEKLWPNLGTNLENILNGTYKGLKTTVFEMFRRGRSADDIRSSSLRLLTTVQNKISSISRVLAEKLESRLTNEKNHKSTKMIKMMGKCFDIGNIIEKGIGDDDFNKTGEENLKKLMKKAKYDDVKIKETLKEYNIFKERAHNLNKCEEQTSDMMKMFEHVLYKTHECNETCTAKYNKTCKEKGKVILPKQFIPMKFLHIFLKEKDLYTGIHNFLHFLLRCVMKTHAEGVAESMGNYIEMHCDKRRGLDIETLGKESYMHWNGPPVHLTEQLGIKVLNRIFKGDSWHFVTRRNKAGSVVTRRLKCTTAKLPYF